MKITNEDYIKALNDAYAKGYREGFKDGSQQKNNAPSTATPPYAPNPIGNPITNPMITWDARKTRDVIQPIYHQPNDDELYEKAPYWLNPKFRISPVWSLDTTTTAKTTPFNNGVSIS